MGCQAAWRRAGDVNRGSALFRAMLQSWPPAASGTSCRRRVGFKLMLVKTREFSARRRFRPACIGGISRRSAVVKSPSIPALVWPGLLLLHSRTSVALTRGIGRGTLARFHVCASCRLGRTHGRVMLHVFVRFRLRGEWGADQRCNGQRADSQFELHHDPQLLDEHPGLRNLC